MLDKKQYEKLLDDLKILCRLEKIVRDEDNSEKRKFASLIVEDIVQRLYTDIHEMYDEKYNTVDFTKLIKDKIEGGK